MTNYNERLYEIIDRLFWAGVSMQRASHDSRNLKGLRAIEDKAKDDAKQAFTSLIKELVADAKPTNSETQWGSVIVYGDLSERDLKIVNQFEQNLLKELEEV